MLSRQQPRDQQVPCRQGSSRETIQIARHVLLCAVWLCVSFAFRQPSALPGAAANGSKGGWVGARSVSSPLPTLGVEYHNLRRRLWPAVLTAAISALVPHIPPRRDRAGALPA
eukprot:362932-Chlamydomonas_euryale.AAC.8